MSDFPYNTTESGTNSRTPLHRDLRRTAGESETTSGNDVWLARSGDRAAFDRLVGSHQDAAVAYAISVLGGTNFDLARDAAQDAFVDAWLYLRALREPAAFAGWLRRIVRKHCDRVTRGDRARTISLDAAVEVAAPADSADPALVAEKQDLGHRIWAALNSLPVSERAVVLLYYIDSHSHADIGAFLGIAAKTVKSRLHTARRRLRERMRFMIDDEMTTFVDASLKQLGTEARPSRDDTFAVRVAALIAAIDNRDDSTVTRMITETPELANAQTPRPFWDGNVRALHTAVEAGNVEAARALIKGGADVNAFSDKHEWKPLHLALVHREPEMLSLLLGAGATLDVFSASGLGDAARLRELLAADPELAKSAAGPDGATPLHFAADALITEILLDAAGADMEARDAFHDGSALAWAVSGGNGSVTADLLERGAELDLWVSCALDQASHVESLLAADPAIVNQPSTERNVLRLGFVALPLHYAARYGSVETVAMLLHAGADIAALSGDGSLPIHDAAYMGHTAVVEMLLNHGSPTNDREHLYQATPLGVAEYANRTEAAALLRSRGGEV